MVEKITKINQCPKGLETFKVPLGIVRMRDAFHRSDWGNLVELALDIKTNGQRQPATVLRKEENGEVFFEIIHGERRYKAIKIANDKLNAGIDYILASNAPKNALGKTMSEADILYYNMSSNNGKEFTQLECGYISKRLIEYGQKVEVIAERFGKSMSWVRQCLDLANSSPAIQRAIKKGDIKPTTARKLSKAPKKIQETALLEKDLNPDKKIKGKDVDKAINEDKEKDLDDTIKEKIDADAIAGILKKLGLKTISEAKESNTLYANNVEVRIDQKKPPLIIMLTI